MSALTPDDRVAAALTRLKVFPLPSAVLFPGVSMPLHIFEPRYRALVKDALSTDGVLALAGLEEGWEEDDAGRPRLSAVACAGIVSWHETLGGGRYNLLLEGRVRVRVLRELPSVHPYREVEAERMEEQPYEGPEESVLRQALLELATQLPQEAAQVLVREAARARGGALADVVAAAVVADAEVQRRLLEEPSALVRLRTVMDELTDVLARMRPARPRGPLN